jgi:MaoC like domain
VNQFADVTEDHNYIHVDRERADAGPSAAEVRLLATIEVEGAPKPSVSASASTVSTRERDT